MTRQGDSTWLQWSRAGPDASGDPSPTTTALRTPLMPYIHFGRWRLHYHHGHPWFCLRVAVVGFLWTMFALFVLQDIYMRIVSIYGVVWRLFLGSLLWEVVSSRSLLGSCCGAVVLGVSLLIPQYLSNPRPASVNSLPVTMARPTGV